MMLVEKAGVNRMHDALDLFQEIVNNTWFEKVHIILFLNKRDLFEEKIKRVDIKTCFPNYDGGKDFKKASEYIKNKFLSRVNGKRDVYTHLTIATDTQNIKTIDSDVRNLLLNETLGEAFGV